MLFALPTSASGVTTSVAPTAASAPVSGLGVFPSSLGAIGTALRSMAHKTVVRSGFHGWFAERQPVTFQAERKKQIGTALLSPITSRAVAGFHGWFTARPAGHFSKFFNNETKSSIGTAAASSLQTVECSGFHGWFAELQPGLFNGPKKQLGTALHSSITSRVAADFHGWFTARPVEGVFQHGKKSPIGTAAASSLQTVERLGFHGWFAKRQPGLFMCGVPTSGSSNYHVSVLPNETVEWMAATSGKFIIDGTLGGGGHSEMFLESGAQVLGIDRDPEALAHATERLARFGDRFRTWHGNFADLRDYPEVQGGELADGLLLDLGVSSRQLDAPERGFSFRGEGPLDMRMGPATEMTAADVVNTWPEDELRQVLREYGEEPRARRIAAAIVKQRDKQAFETTTQLADCIERAVGRSGRTHPATRSFQAIRILVNDELGSLERALEASVDLIKPGGRLLVITFHSLEDRMVKRFMRERSQRWVDRPDWPEPRPNPRLAFRLPHRKAIAPSDEEIQRNARARSAKLRVAELLEPAPSES